MVYEMSVSLTIFGLCFPFGHTRQNLVGKILQHKWMTEEEFCVSQLMDWMVKVDVVEAVFMEEAHYGDIRVKFLVSTDAHNAQRGGWWDTASGDQRAAPGCC